jgi:Poly A polymerase regulatory subunit
MVGCKELFIFGELTGKRSVAAKINMASIEAPIRDHLLSFVSPDHLPPFGFHALHPKKETPDEDGEMILRLVDKFYGFAKKKSKDPADTVEKSKDPAERIDWNMLTTRLYPRYHLMTDEQAATVLTRRSQRAAVLVQTYESYADPKHHELIALLEQTKTVLPNEPWNWPSNPNYFGTRVLPYQHISDMPCDPGKKDPNCKRDPKGTEDHGAHFILGVCQDLAGLEKRPGNIVMPFGEELVKEPEVSWNPLTNMAMMVACMNHSDRKYPMRIILHPGWENSLADDQTYSPPVEQYQGVVFVNFDDSDVDTTPQQGRFYNKNIRCKCIPLLVYKDDSTTNNTTHLFYTRFRLRTLDGHNIDWGDYAPRKRITYYELRQIMSYTRKETDPWHLSHPIADEDGGNIHLFVSRVRVNDPGKMRQVQLVFVDEYVNGSSFPQNECRIQMILKNVPSAAVTIAEKDRMTVMTEESLKLLESMYFGWPTQVVIGSGTVQSPPDLRRGLIPGYAETLRQVERLRRTASKVEHGQLLARHQVLSQEIKVGPIVTQLASDGVPVVDGLRQKRATPERAFVTPYGSAYLKDVAQLGARQLILASNGNVAEASVTVGATKVVLWLLALTNSQMIEKLISIHPKVLDVQVAGVLLVRLPTVSTMDGVWLDVETLEDYPKLCNLLCGLVSILAKGVLRKGGNMNISMPLPRRMDDAAWRLLNGIVHCFASPVSIDPDVDVQMPFCPAFVRLGGFSGVVPSQLSRDASGLKSRLEIGRTGASDLYGISNIGSLPVRSDLKDAMDAAYKGYCRSIASRVSRACKGRGTRPPALSAAPISDELLSVEPRNPILQLSWRDAMLLRSFELLRDMKFTYDEDSHDFEPRCHWGQYKLLASEWDMLNTCRTEITSMGRDIAILYVGAAHGQHLPIIANLFPELRAFHAYDGARFDECVHRHPRIRVFQGSKEGFVTDGRIPGILATLRSEAGPTAAIIFICDMRLETDEASVHRDMMTQARWGARIGAERMLLKFRPPYPDKQGRIQVRNPSPRDVFPGATAPKDAPPAGKQQQDSFLYLEGRVQMQLFATIHTTEARLVVKAPLRLAWYDPVDHEQKCNAFNLGLRRVGVPQAPAMDLYLMGHDRGFESQEILRIARTYLGHAVHLAPKGEELIRACALIRDVEKHLVANTRRTLMECVKLTLEKKFKSKPKKVRLWMQMQSVNLRDMTALSAARARIHTLPMVSPYTAKLKRDVRKKRSRSRTKGIQKRYT